MTDWSASALLHRLPLTPLVEGEGRVVAIETDSRAVDEGALFMARRGWFVDANRYVPGAVEAGASAIVVTDAASAADGVPTWLSAGEDRDGAPPRPRRRLHGGRVPLRLHRLRAR